MKIPKKINPDNLKNTIVQVLFNPGIAPELVLGTFNFNLSDTFDFVATSPKRREVKVAETKGLILESIERGYFLDKSKHVKVDISSNGITFNTFEKYIGWEKYFPIISSTLAKLFDIGLIKDISRIGVRYISQFDNVSLIDNLNMNLSIESPNKNLESTQVRSEYVDENFKIILTLINKINQIQNNSQTPITTSIIDVDVIQLFDGLADQKAVSQIIENGHQKQKATFFTLLRPEFLKTLNPEY